MRRSVAPLLAGALLGTLVVTTAGDAAVVRGVLAQSTEPAGPNGPAGPDGTAGPGTIFDLAPDADERVPLEDLDLDTLVEADSDFDTDAVFPDLFRVGEIFDLYGYGEERRVDVAEELELVVPDERAGEFDGEPVPDAGGDPDEDDEARVVTARAAAERFLLDERCSALFALGIREQVSRPIRARILRDDEELIAQLESLTEGTELPTGVEPLTTLPAGRVFVDSLGSVHALPLESVVEVGRVTVSVFDPDLVRARPAALLEQLAEEADLAGTNPGDASPDDVSPDDVATSAFLETVWTSCLTQAAADGTMPALDTISGDPVWTLALDRPLDVGPTFGESGTDVVTWLEPGLEIRVQADFDAVDDGISVNPFVDLDTKTWLETFADPAQVAKQVATVIATRDSDPTELLFREAFAGVGGFEYGDEISGAEAAARTELRRSSPLAALLAGPLGTPPAGPEETLVGVVERPLFRDGVIATNRRRNFSTPAELPASADLVPPVATVQAAVWAPETLNSDAFRSAWKDGIRHASDVFVDVDDPDFQEATGVSAGDLRDQGIVAAVGSVREGLFRFHWLAPCYSASIAGPAGAAAGIGALGDAVALAQQTRRVQVFGDRPDPFAGTGPDLDTAPLDYGLREGLFDQKVETHEAEERAAEAERRPVGPAVEALLFDHPVASEKFAGDRDEARDAAAAAERELEDAARIARCGSPNLRAFSGGAPVPDFDDNGIDDRLAENDVPTSPEQVDAEEAGEADDDEPRDRGRRARGRGDAST